MQQLVISFAGYLREELMRSPATIRQYIDVMEEFTQFLVEKCGPAVALESAEPSMLVDFLRQGCSLTGEPSRSVWNSRLAALRAFGDYLYKKEVIRENPALRINRLKVSPKEPVPLSLDEYLALVDAMEGSPAYYRGRNVALVQVLYHCALRVSEVVSLNIGQVDLQNHVFENVRTKGGKWLSIPFNDLTAAALERYLPDREKLRPHEHEPALFLSDRRQRLSVRAVQELVKVYGRGAGILRTVTPHLLRHSGATELADLGVPIRVIQGICNHASIMTTQRYVHLKGTARRSAIDLLGATVAKRAEARRAPAEPVSVDSGERPGSA